MRFRRFWGRQPQPATPPQTVSEIPWREGDTSAAPTGISAQPSGDSQQGGSTHAPVYYGPAKKAQTVSEIHWRRGVDAQTRS